MRPGGVVMLIAGVWLGCQLWGGDALQRLNLIGAK
jgi:hypothetical protein